MRSRWLAPLFVVATVVFGFAVYGDLPAQVPSKWDLSGRATETQPRLLMVALLPAVCLGLWLALFVLPVVDPLKRSYEKFGSTFRLFVNVVVIFVALTHALILANALGWGFSVPKTVTAGAGFLLLVLGNELGRVRPNWFVGIRTPWTLSDPEVWRRTHRLGGRVLFVTGLFLLTMAFALPDSGAIIALVFGMAGAVVFLVAYSYLLWAARQTAEDGKDNVPAESKEE